MDSSEYDYLFKLVVIGDSGVGKSSICTRIPGYTWYTKGVYNDRSLTTQWVSGGDFESHTITLDDKIIKLQIHNIKHAGQSYPPSLQNHLWPQIQKSFYGGARGIIIVFDITNTRSFENVKHWLEEVNQRGNRSWAQTPYILLLGNKCDQENKRMISFDAANEYAKKLNIPYMETSAIDGINVDQAFLNMASEIKTRVVTESLKSNTRIAKIIDQECIQEPKYNTYCQIL